MIEVCTNIHSPVKYEVCSFTPSLHAKMFQVIVIYEHVTEVYGRVISKVSLNKWWVMCDGRRTSTFKSINSEMLTGTSLVFASTSPITIMGQTEDFGYECLTT